MSLSLPTLSTTVVVRSIYIPLGCHYTRVSYYYAITIDYYLVTITTQHSRKMYQLIYNITWHLLCATVILKQ